MLHPRGKHVKEPEREEEMVMKLRDLCTKQPTTNNITLSHAYALPHWVPLHLFIMALLSISFFNHLTP